MVRVKPAIIVADLVDAHLERRDSLSYEGGDEVVGLQLVLLDEFKDVGIIPLDLSPRILQEVLLIVLLDRSTSSVVRQVVQVHCRISVLHVEPASEPFLDRSESLHVEELGILPRLHLSSSDRRHGLDAFVFGVRHGLGKKSVQHDPQI